MWVIRPKGKFGRGRQAVALVFLLVILLMFGAVLFGGAGCFSVGVYCVDRTVLMALALIALGVFVVALRRPRL